ncbi:hypothetical protein NPIL_332431 [Nephila pilipes]|uniref:Uncharacterized protein n=1 Tax=Nephila pilipes TaxID=299642 RepID=A0A8X6T705_NEPPI|nr:hypothetical protein NPIL_332431 [Nephila pilipes]
MADACAVSYTAWHVPAVERRGDTICRNSYHAVVATNTILWRRSMRCVIANSVTLAPRSRSVICNISYLLGACRADVAARHTCQILAASRYSSRSTVDRRCAVPRRHMSSHTPVTLQPYSGSMFDNSCTRCYLDAARYMARYGLLAATPYIAHSAPFISLRSTAATRAPLDVAGRVRRVDGRCVVRGDGRERVQHVGVMVITTSACLVTDKPTPCCDRRVVFCMLYCLY